MEGGEKRYENVACCSTDLMKEIYEYHKNNVKLINDEQEVRSCEVLHKEKSDLSLAIMKNIEEYDISMLHKNVIVQDRHHKTAFTEVLKDIQNENHDNNKSDYSRHPLRGPQLLLPPSVDDATTMYSQWSCAICLEGMSEKNPLSINCRAWQFCVSCLTNYVKLQIEEKTVNMSAQWTIRCPCHLDGCELSRNDIQRIVENVNNDLPEELRSLLMVKFQKFALDLEVQNDPTRGNSWLRCDCFVILQVQRIYLILSLNVIT